MTECVLWPGVTDSQGYGRQGGRLVHRIAFEWLVGPIPAGLQLDHTCHTRDVSCAGGPTCRHRRCIEPDHLEPVTSTENSRRGRHAGSGWQRDKTHCLNGHPFDEANTYLRRPGQGGRRTCRACGAMRARAAYRGRSSRGTRR